MSREIKFRAWDKEIESMSLDPFTLQEVMGTNRGMELSVGRELIFMQFTGLLDKNGKEIHEGDIVYLAGYGDYIVEFPFMQLYDSAFEGDIGEIIGNVKENPELLDK